MSPMLRWAPAAILAVGALLTVGIDTQRDLPLRAPLAEVIPTEINGLESRNITISPAELRAAGVSDYLMRGFRTVDSAASPMLASLYIGYYERQTQGRTVHSPKNCLPGSGWQALASRRATIETAHGPVTVNRYMVKRGEQTALVLYWYQGRGRVQSNEYIVKWDLLRDAALRQRSEEALVRIVVPIRRDEAEAYEAAERLARTVVPALNDALPI